MGCKLGNLLLIPSSQQVQGLYFARNLIPGHSGHLHLGREEERNKGSKEEKEYVALSQLAHMLSSNIYFIPVKTTLQISTKSPTLNCNSGFVPTCHCPPCPEYKHFQLFILKKQMEVCFWHCWLNKQAFLRACTVSDKANELEQLILCSRFDPQFIANLQKGVNSRTNSLGIELLPSH